MKSSAFGLTVAALLAINGCATIPQTIDAPTAACKPNPIGTRSFYLRGGFNTWTAHESKRFAYGCNRYELVAKINGEHSFKIGDEEWSPDADLGVAVAHTSAQNTPLNTAVSLIPKGKELHTKFDGTYRFTLNMTDTKTPSALTIEPCITPPLGAATLYLRGSINNWTTLEDYAFQFSCDAYYLNVKIDGTQDFKIADANWTNNASFGNGPNDVSTLEANKTTPLARLSDVGRTNNLRFKFSGEHTIRLAFAGGQPRLTIGPKTFADPSAVLVEDPIALSLHHDSRKLADKAPFGAVPAATKVQFGLSANAGVSSINLVIEKRRLEGNQDILEYTEVARIPMQKTSAEKLDRWEVSHAFNDVSVYGYYFEMVVNGKTFIYQNNREAIYWTREKGSNGVGRIEDKPDNARTIRRFRHTVFAADYVVPAWAKDIVYYYIFPDRFRNGNPANNQKVGVTTYHDKQIEFHNNWLDKPYKPNSGDGSDAHYNNDFFGGDLAGIIEKLDYVADLGANTIYMTPVFQASSNHKYDTADYKNIDPNFGTNEDFIKLTKEAEKRGIRVIPDTSLNHTGSDSIYFDRFNKHTTGGASLGAFTGAKIQENSLYASWYTFDKTQSDPDKQYKGWLDVLDLPELNKNAPAWRSFAYSDADSVMKLWLDRGAAGWRMDVVPWVPDSFWREWRTAIRQHTPDALTIAETWFDSSKYFLGDSFDSTMNYIFRNAVQDYAKGGKAPLHYSNIEYIREVYPQQSFYALMNLLSSHDSARSLHVFGATDEKDEAALALAKKRLRLAAFFQMTFPGAPTIYYGDEVGVGGGDDPYNRATYPWADLGGKPDLALHSDYKMLIKMRKDHAILRHGSLDAPIYMDDNVIGLVRKLNGSVALTFSNNADIAKQITVTLPTDVKAFGFKDALSGEVVSADKGTVTVSVPALFGRVLIGQ